MGFSLTIRRDTQVSDRRLECFWAFPMSLIARSTGQTENQVGLSCVTARWPLGCQPLGDVADREDEAPIGPPHSGWMRFCVDLLNYWAKG